MQLPILRKQQIVINVLSEWEIPGNCAGGEQIVTRANADQQQQEEEI